MTLPVFCRTRPPKRGKPVRHLAKLRLCTVANGGKIRDKAGIPKEKRYCEMSRDRKYVPKQCRIEVWPKGTTAVRIRKHEEAIPYATHVEDWKLAGTHHCEDRHRL